ncbi:BatD family protein [Desulfogranum mediterraneum]|uniref:BatD family protein n=1 Tax=Desulfogranum mediterraneum TaxID=160661 RepID=UPI00048B5BF5|nr:BatD family protein [Desulfogranum mediterraneum]
MNPNRCRPALLPLLLICLLLLGLFGRSPASGATLSARVDRNPVALDESVRLELTIDDPSAGEPDFTPLESAFEILGQSSSSNIQIINGRQSRSRSYQLTLMPRRAGTLTIPAIRVGSAQSNPLELVVTDPAAPSGGREERDLFLEVEASPSNPYLQAQILYTVRLYIGLSLANGSLSEPAAEQLTVHKLGQDREFSTSRDGRGYRVIERRYALFARQSGPLIIPPLVFQGQSGRSSASLFDPFGRVGPSRRVRSQAVELEVKPPPVQAELPWLPASEFRASLERSDPDAPIRAGEPLTLTLTLEAHGLAGSTLPEPRIRGDEALRLYPDQADFEQLQEQEGMVGILRKKIAVIPARAGSFRLEAIEIPWWNTSRQRPELARIPAMLLEVEPGLSHPGTGSGQAQETVPPSAAQAAPTVPTEPTHPGLKSNPWFWLSGLLAGAWLLTLLAWRQSRRSQKTNKAGEADEKGRPAAKAATELRELAGQLRQACRRHQPRQARQLLSRLAQLAPLESLQPLEEELDRLNRYLYAQEDAAEAWDGSALWQAWQTWEQTRKGAKQRGSARRGDGLVPLYGDHEPAG